MAKKRKSAKRKKEQQLAIGVNRLAKLLLLAAEADNEPLPEPEPFCLLIDDIKLLKLKSFINMYVNKDYTDLILAGEPTDEQLHACGEKLKLQYFDASGNEKAVQSYKRNALLNTYILFINRVRMNMEAISAHYDEDLVNELREDGFDYLLTPETLESDLKLISNELTGWEVKCEQLILEQDEENGNEPAQEINEEFFLEQLAELRKFEGFNTPVTRLADEMTVYDYCISMKRFNKHHQKAIIEEHGNGQD